MNKQTTSTENTTQGHKKSCKINFPSIDTIIPKNPGAASRQLKICIATEDIVGPIRNGGIGTTYTHLSFLLAELGHDVTIMYLRGEHTESDDIEKWIEWYRDRGVRFVPLDATIDNITASRRWINPMYALYQRLLQEHYDVVHASEWRASAYLCLLAKQQNLAFKNTIFCIKTSSPWLWNRENGMRILDDMSDLIKIYAERRSVELADIVIGGSTYLLNWMHEHGYELPKARTFVQPNVIKPIDLPRQLLRNRPEYGSRVAVREIVFFGRLENRKGLDLFCEAISSLLKQGYEVPAITFMGKFGAKLPTYPDLTIEEFITQQSESWPMSCTILNNFNQTEALKYLHGEGILAVMPSVAENSTLTVYETTHFSIPFIATDVGGTSELIADIHRNHVLADPHPVSIATKIKEALEKGGMVAAPSFDNDENLKIWNEFHSNLSIILDNEGWPPASLGKDADHIKYSDRQPNPSTSICLVLRDDPERIETIIEILLSDTNGDCEIILVNDGSEEKTTKQWLKVMDERAIDYNNKFVLLSRPHYGYSSAWNYAAGRAEGEYLLFLDPGAYPRRQIVDVLSRAAAASNASILLPFYSLISSYEYSREKKDERNVIFLAGDPAYTFFKPMWRSPAVYVKREIFNRLGGLSTDYNIPAAMEEFIAKAVVANDDVAVVPENMVYKLTDYPGPEHQDKKAIDYRTARPYINSASPYFQPLYMTAKGLDAKWRALRRNNENYKSQLAQARSERNLYKKERNREIRKINRMKNQGIFYFLRRDIKRLEDISPKFIWPVFWAGRFVARSIYNIFCRLK